MKLVLLHFLLITICSGADLALGLYTIEIEKTTTRWDQADKTKAPFHLFSSDALNLRKTSLGDRPSILIREKTITIGKSVFQINEIESQDKLVTLTLSDIIMTIKILPNQDIEISETGMNPGSFESLPFIYHKKS